MRIRHADRGATALEYALLVAAVAGMLMFAAPALLDALASRADWIMQQTSGQPGG